MKSVFFAHIPFLIAALMLVPKPTNLPGEQGSSEPSDEKKMLVTGVIEFTGRYCGGANPPKMILENARKKRPLTDYKLYVKAGKLNRPAAPIIDSSITNAEGRFEFNLPPGEYVVLTEFHLNKDIFRNWSNDRYIGVSDWRCLEEWWQKGLTRIKVDNRPLDNLYLHFQKQCFLPIGVPCLEYTGPLPP